VINADGSGLTQLTHEADGSGSFHPDWSPDGTRLLFAHRAAGASHVDLDVMDMRTGAVATIWRGADGSSASRPAWGSRP